MNWFSARLTFFLFSLTALVSCSSFNRSSIPATPAPVTGGQATLADAPITTGKANKAPSAAATSAAAAKAQSLMASLPGLQQLTSLGINSEGRYSGDGSRVIFVSRARPSHTQAQIYELHLANQTEKRLSYHDGEDRLPTYSPDGSQLLYSSNTDELKEEPVAMRKVMATYYPEGIKILDAEKKTKDHISAELSELYFQSLNGRVVERVTKTRGFDGEADFDPQSKNRRLTFVSTRDGSPSIYLQTGPSGAARRLSNGNTHDRAPRFSPDGKLIVHSRQQPESTTTRLSLLEKSFKSSRPLTAGAGDFLDLSPSWHPKGEVIVFSSNRGGSKFNLFTIDREGKCLKRLTKVEVDQLHPAFSPDGKKLIFTGQLLADENGNSFQQIQLYTMDYQPTGECMSMDPTSSAQ